MGTGVRVVHAAELSDQQLGDAVRRPSATLAPREALFELARRGAPSFSPVARDALHLSTDDPPLRRAAAVALGRVVDADNQAALLGALGEADPVLVRLAASSLGRIADPSALTALGEWTARGPAATRRAVAFARTLVAYRHGLDDARLRRPPNRLVRSLSRQTAVPLEIQSVPPDAFDRAEDDLRSQAPGIALARDTSVRLSCLGEDLWIVLGDDAARDAGAHLARRAAVAAVVLKRNTCPPESWYVHEYVLSHPLSDGSVAAFGVRPSGRMAHVGDVAPSAGASQLRLQALDVAGVPAVALTFAYGGPQTALEVREALRSPSVDASGRGRLTVRPS